MSKVIANDVRVGNVIEHQNRLWRVTKTMHTMPGKGGAFMQVEMKDIMSGTKTNERFRSSESVEIARIDTKEYQYLFADDTTLTLMDPETFEQITLDKDMLGDQAVFLQDGMEILAEVYEEKIVGAQLPETVVLTITETEAVVKGQTAASSYKPAICDNGVRIMVPPFISTGEKVVVKTTDSSYVERAK